MARTMSQEEVSYFSSYWPSNANETMLFGFAALLLTVDWNLAASSCLRHLYPNYPNPNIE
jgi:hypothetical protein